MLVRMSTHELEEASAGDPQIRRAKFVLFVLVMLLVSGVIVVMLVFFQPRDQVVIQRWPNGYPRTETHCVLDSVREPVPHGKHRAWHENGTLAEEGRYEQGRRIGVWRFWDPEGQLDEALSGLYAADRRERPLESGER